jgi:hypothetical protein
VAGKALTVEQILTVLAESPKRIAELTAGRPEADLRSEPAPDEWSVSEVLAHLRACSDVWGRNIATILAEERPTLTGVSPRTWIDRTDYRELKFRPSLRAFTRQRAELLAVLEPLPPPLWSRAADVSAWGQVHAKSVHDYADKLARHERTHVQQIEAILRAG